MCNTKDAPMISRKTRTKTRKPKFLSLRLKLSPETTQHSGEMINPTSTASASAAHSHQQQQQQQQLNLFPLHPENLVEDKDTTMAYFFDAADCGASATLTTLLGAGSSSRDDGDDNSLSPSLTYACGGQDSGEGELLRTALRSKERDASEERWVSYEEVTSCAAGLRCKVRKRGLLSLKLDYQEILNAWSDKGPLYIQLESPQTVPNLVRDDFFAHDHYSSSGLKDDWGSNNGGGLWTVPENSISSGNIGNTQVKKEEAIFQGGEWKQQPGQREVSVLRYKEKKQNRLFSKRIRYEVRKINAEKRPRMKGRFVKRS